jgi:dTDP-glucose pyrophosphorylase
MNHDLPDKAVILARGRGTRMSRADANVVLDERQAAVADQGIKAMIPIGRPFLDYVLSAVADAGYRRICLVVGPEQETIRTYYGREVELSRITVEFAVQQAARGTADAVASVEAFAAGEPFLMLNCDNYYPAEALRALHGQPGSAVALFEQAALLTQSNIPAERVRRFSVAEFDQDDCLRRIIEKPDAATYAALPPPLWINMNCWRFEPSIFAACRAISPSPRGEYELPDAVQYAIDRLGVRFRAIRWRAPVLDLTGRSDIPVVAGRLAGVTVRL